MANQRERISARRTVFTSVRYTSSVDWERAADQKEDCYASSGKEQGVQRRAEIFRGRGRIWAARALLANRLANLISLYEMKITLISFCERASTSRTAGGSDVRNREKAHRPLAAAFSSMTRPLGSWLLLLYRAMKSRQKAARASGQNARQLQNFWTLFRGHQSHRVTGYQRALGCSYPCSPAVSMKSNLLLLFGGRINVTEHRHTGRTWRLP